MRVVIVEGDGGVLVVNLGHPVVTNRDFVARTTRFSQITYGSTCLYTVAVRAKLFMCKMNDVIVL